LAGFCLPTNITGYLPKTQPPNDIMAYAWQQQKDGKADSTVQTIIVRLTRLAKTADLTNPEQVKEILAKAKWKATTKTLLVQIYNGYLKYNNQTWNAPSYTIEETLPFIPTETEIDTLIHAAYPTMAALLQLLKETGARIGEIQKFKWTHLDLERKTIYITAEKGSNSRKRQQQQKPTRNHQTHSYVEHDTQNKR
jgi:integrase